MAPHPALGAHVVCLRAAQTYLAYKGKESNANVKAIEPQWEDGCLCHGATDRCHIVEVRLRVLDVSAKGWKKPSEPQRGFVSQKVQTQLPLCTHPLCPSYRTHQAEGAP